MKYDFCFIVTYGRSGSTLLQGVLNAVPGVLIRGENGGVLNEMYHLSRHLLKNVRAMSSISVKPSDAWFGLNLIEKEELFRHIHQFIREAIIKPRLEDKCVGFKEIRYGQDHIKELDDMVEFIRAVFPNSCIIYNSRNVADTAKSGWWSTRPDAEEYLELFRSRMLDCYRKYPDFSYWIEYDEYVAEPEKLQNLFQFLGVTLTHNQVLEALTIRHSA